METERELDEQPRDGELAPGYGERSAEETETREREAVEARRGAEEIPGAEDQQAFEDEADDRTGGDHRRPTGQAG